MGEHASPGQGRAAGEETRSALLGRRLAPLALFALVVAVYAPSMDHEFIYDDHPIMTEPAPRSLRDLAAVFTRQTTFNLPYFRPVSRVTVVAQRYVHGDQPAPFHLANAVLMGAAVLLGYAVLRLPVFGVERRLALLGAALFGLHPAASSIVYPFTSGRESLVPAVWVLAAVYAFLRGGRRWYALSMAAFALSLFSKEQAVIAPLLFALGDRLGLSADAPGRSPRRWLARYLPVAAILLFYAAVRWKMFGGGGQHHLAVLTHPSGPLLSLLYALQTTFTPFLSFAYEPPLGVWFSLARLSIWAVAVVLVALAARRRWPELRPALLFWLGWFVVALLPTANLLAQEARFTERYVFLSLLGAIGVLAVLASDGWSRPAVRRWTYALGISALLACAALSVQRASYFRNDRAFVGQWLLTNPASAQAHFIAGDVHAAADELDEAIRQYRLALEIAPHFAEIHYNLAKALLQQGRRDEATQHYYRALQIDPDYARSARE